MTVTSVVDLPPWTVRSDIISKSRNPFEDDTDSYANFNNNLGLWLPKMRPRKDINDRLSVFLGDATTLSSDILVLSCPLSFQPNGDCQLFSDVFTLENDIFSDAELHSSKFHIGDVKVLKPQVLEVEQLVCLFPPTEEHFPRISDLAVAAKVAEGKVGTAINLKALITSVFDYGIRNNYTTFVFPIIGSFDFL
ncbi:hypothetical protein GEMRC1_009433 [Eukaryota sp. GEM-RC1]